MRPLLTVFVTLLLSACPDPGNLPDAGVSIDASVSLDSFCAGSPEDFLCGFRKACGFADPSASCALVLSSVRLGPGCSLPLLAAVDAGRVIFDATRAGACLARTTVCGSTYDACTGVFRGTGAENSSCATSPECTPGLYCDLNTSCPGICRPQQSAGATVSTLLACSTPPFDLLADGGVYCEAFVGLGDQCRDSAGPRCQFGLNCSQGVCVATHALGGSCSTQDDCSVGLRCSGGVCTSFGSTGETCSSSSCKFGLACRNGACGTPPTLGQSCRADYRCSLGLRCDGTADSCVSAEVGAACREYYDCRSGLSCQNGKCSELQPVGGPCATSMDCEQKLSCKVGRCAIATCE